MISQVSGPTGPDGSPTTRPDLSIVCDILVSDVEQRKYRVSSHGYVPKVRDSCPLSCCQYLHTEQEDEAKLESDLEKVIIRRVIHRRRRKQVSSAEEKPVEEGPAAPEPDRTAANTIERELQGEAPQLEYQQQQDEQERKEELARQQKLEEEKQQQVAEAQQRATAADAEEVAVAAPPATPTQKIATFQNTGSDPTMATAELYYESTRWGPLGHNDPPVSVGSFPGHRWFIVANGIYAKQFTVGEEDVQTFTI